jgi:hypothetical protein
VGEERKSGEPPGVVPLLIGGPPGTGGPTGRHRSLVTVSLKGIPEDKQDGFVSSLKALGFRVTRTGGKLVVPAKDRSAVQGIIDIERLKSDEVAQRSDDRWWYGLVDAASDLADADPDGLDEEPVRRYLSAHESFVRRGVGAGFRYDVHGQVLGLADATATFLRSGRPERAVRCAGVLYDTARRLH